MSKIEVENINHPGRSRKVDAVMYEVMRRAYLAVVPASRPGLTIAEIHARLPERLPHGLFPDGVRAGWWAKTVQLDLEAKQVIKRTDERPLRLHRA